MLAHMASIIRRFLSFLLVISIFASCSGKQTEKNGGETKDSSEPTTDGVDPGFTPEDNEKATEPVEINGSFLVDLACIVTNQSDTEAMDTAVACKLVDKRGEKFKGKLENPSASVVLGSSTTDVSGIVTVLGPDDSDSFVVIFTGVSPQDALGITLNATLDGEVSKLQAAFSNGGATVSLADKDLYVSAAADASNGGCSKDAPCRSIGRALLFVPDIIAHRISIHIAAGEYAESIKISGKSFRQSGSLTLAGKTENWEGSVYTNLKGDLTQSSNQPVVTISGNSGSNIFLNHLKIDSCKNFGIIFDGSNATIGNIRIANCTNPAAVARTKFLGLLVDNASEVVLHSGVYWMDLFTFPTYISDPKCDANPVPSNTDCRLFSTHGIFVKNQSSFMIVGPVINPLTNEVANAIDLQPRLESGIVASIDSTISIRSVNPVKIFIKDALRAVYIDYRSSFADFTILEYPTPAKRLFLSVESADYGLWVDGAEFLAAFADLEFSECLRSCLHANNNGRINIGRDAFSTSFGGGPVSKLALNTVRATATPSEGYVGFAGSGSTISILPTAETLKICHTPTVAKKVFDAGYNAEILVRVKPDVLTAMKNNICVNPTLGLGNVNVDLGKIAVSSGPRSETLCAHDTSFSACVNAQIPPIP